MFELLSTGFIDFTVFPRLHDSTFSLQTFETFQPAWILVMSIVFVSLKQSIHTFTPNSGRIVGLIHAVCSVVIGFPVLFMLAETSFAYSDMYESFMKHYGSIMVTCNAVCYLSVGYFLMDSYFLLHTAYLKHHIGAIIVWMATAYHHETSLVHGCVTLCIFETGALLVQCSRMFPNVLWFRTLVCIGYTCTRLALGWYYGFILYTSIQFWASISLYVKLVYIPIWLSLVFLFAINAKWTMMQWKALRKAYVSNNVTDFYSFHQTIIGNSR